MREKIFYYIDFVLAPLVATFVIICHNNMYGVSWKSLLVFVSGVLFWTFLEYVFHRYAHVHPKLRKEHMRHHRYPKEVTGPSSVSTIITYAGIWFVLSIASLWFATAFFPGILWGYAFYLHLHNAIHRIKMPDWKWFRNKAHYHEEHHKGKRRRFGVSTSLWDRIFKK